MTTTTTQATTGTPPTNDLYLIEIQVNHDSYPGETAWELRNVDTGSTLLEQLQDDVTTEFVTITDSVQVPAGIYRFEITDSFSDGICCGYGNGSYTVSVNGETVGSGGDFGRRDDVHIVVGLWSYTSSLLDAIAGEVENFVLIPPTVFSLATCSTTGPSGTDADLYASFDAFTVIGDPSQNDCAPLVDGSSNETCLAEDFDNNPVGDILFVSVHAFTDFNDVVLSCALS